MKFSLPITTLFVLQGGCASVAASALSKVVTTTTTSSSSSAQQPFIDVQKHKRTLQQEGTITRRVQSDNSDVLPVGVWTMDGYGYTIDIQSESENNGYYDETEISCIMNPILPYYVQNATITSEDSVILDAGQIVGYYLERTDEFQSGCKDGITPLKDVHAEYERDPVYLFDVLAQTFTEHFAFFELREIDWPALTDEARMGLSINSTDEELIEAIVSVLAPLHDGHVTFSAEEYDYTFESKPFAIFTTLLEEFAIQTEYDDAGDYIQTQFRAWIGNIVGYLDDFDLQGSDVGEFSWGTIHDGEVGYMNIISMSPEDSDTFFAEVDQAMADLQDTKVMIIDVRINGGGEDMVGLTIASHFTDERYLAFTKKAIKNTDDGESFSPEQEVYVEASSGEFQYKNKVILLCSNSTVSAAEIFVMAMAENPQVTIMGENTSGELSDMLDKRLPNHWGFTLSNEVYLTPDGISFEMVGIPPTIMAETDVLALSDRQEGIDSWIEQALEIADEMIANMVVENDDDIDSVPSGESTNNPTSVTGSPSLSPSIAPVVSGEDPSSSVSESPTGAPTSGGGSSKNVSLFELLVTFGTMMICVGIF